MFHQETGVPLRLVCDPRFVGSGVDKMRPVLEKDLAIDAGETRTFCLAEKGYLGF